MRPAEAHFHERLAAATAGRTQQDVLAYLRSRPDVRHAYTALRYVIGQLTDGRCFTLSCRRPKPSFAHRERAFLERMVELGGIAGTCRSVADAAALVDAQP